MKEPSRRGFLAVAGTGVAAAAVAPSLLGAESAASAEPGTQGALVAYVKDAAKGQVAVIRGEREVVVTDKALVASIAKHLR